MTKKQTYWLVGGLGVAALGFWWWWSSQQNAAPPVTANTPTGSGGTTEAVTPSPTAVAPSPTITATTTLSANQESELSALLTWAGTTKNPPLYQQMMNQLTGPQVDGLYNILTTQWQAGKQATPAQTAFWNNLRLQFPFLNYGGLTSSGALCTDIACD